MAIYSTCLPSWPKRLWTAIFPIPAHSYESFFHRQLVGIL
jgi:hypothetical protein